MVSINTNLSSLIVQKNLTNSTNALNLAIERMTTGFKINHASDNAANYSISNNMSSQISSYNVAMENAEMGSDMIATASDTLDNMTSNAMRLRELCTQAQNGTYGKQSIDAMKAEANSVIAHIVNQYKSAEYNGIKLFDIYSDKLAELQANSDTPNAPIGLSSDITSPSANYDGFIDDPHTYTDEQVAGFTKLSSVSVGDTISSGTYSISSADELAQLAEMVNAGKVTGGTFVLGDDVDLSSWCAEHTNSDGTGGWTAIGTSSKNFKGTFDGNGHTVSGLYINKETSDFQGLFGYAASGSTIKNVGVDGVVKGKGYVGGLAGASDSITNSYATGSVSGTSSYVGGLAGVPDSITNSYATGSVSGTSSSVGGLAGSSGSITNSYTTGSVSGTGHYVGGLAGESGSITNSYATGSVSGTSSSVGGLAGAAYGNITNSYTTGSVSGKDYVGGLAGYADGTITNSYATGNVSGKDYVGGLAGRLSSDSSSIRVRGSYSTGNVSGSNSIGGLIGEILPYYIGSSVSIGSDISIENCVSFGDVSGQNTVGSFIGSYISKWDRNGSVTVAGDKLSLNNNACASNNTDLIGVYKYYENGGVYEKDNDFDLTPYLENIQGFSTQVQLQVGINGDESSQITTQTNFNIGIIKQLESLDISKASSLEFMDTFLNELSSKSTELGAVTNRLTTALDSIQVSIDNLTSSRSTIKDADIAQVSSEYIRQQILQQASATLLATANQTPAIALQLL